MSNYALEEPPSQLKLGFTLLLVALIAAFNTPLLEMVREQLAARLHLQPGQWSQTYWSACSDLVMCGIFLFEALFLCALTLESSEFGFGDMRAWKRHGYMAGFIWAMPPLMVLSLYPTITDKPYHEWPVAWWLLRSIAQEFLFTGFIYGRMVALFGTPRDGAEGAFSPALLVTAFFYSLYHWPNLRVADHHMTPSYAQFQMLYSLLGMAWMLNIRRWTGSIWPAVLNHILVNWLATVL